MNEALTQRLAEMEAQGRAHDAAQTERSRRMLNLEPDTARLLSILVQSGRKTRGLEVGTSNGYSTLWLADALRRTGGSLVSIDISAEKHALADENLRRASLRDYVTLRTGDAIGVLAGLTDAYDFVFLDAGRRQYPALLPLILPRLLPGGLLLADNVQSHPSEIADYLAAIAANPDFVSVTAGVGKGLSIAYKQ